MTTTTIRIEDELKARVSTAAERAGKTSHAFIIDAIAQKVEQAELDEELHRVAERRWARVSRSGKAVDCSDARTYLEARARGERPPKPAAGRLRP